MESSWAFWLSFASLIICVFRLALLQARDCKELAYGQKARFNAHGKATGSQTHKRAHTARQAANKIVCIDKQVHCSCQSSHAARNAACQNIASCWDHRKLSEGRQQGCQNIANTGETLSEAKKPLSDLLQRACRNARGSSFICAALHLSSFLCFWRPSRTLSMTS